MVTAFNELMSRLQSIVFKDMLLTNIPAMLKHEFSGKIHHKVDNYSFFVDDYRTQKSLNGKECELLVEVAIAEFDMDDLFELPVMTTAYYYGVFDVETGVICCDDYGNPKHNLFETKPNCAEPTQIRMTSVEAVYENLIQQLRTISDTTKTSFEANALFVLNKLKTNEADYKQVVMDAVTEHGESQTVGFKYLLQSKTKTSYTQGSWHYLEKAGYSDTIEEYLFDKKPYEVLTDTLLNKLVKEGVLPKDVVAEVKKTKLVEDGGASLILKVDKI